VCTQLVVFYKNISINYVLNCMMCIYTCIYNCGHFLCMLHVYVYCYFHINMYIGRMYLSVQSYIYTDEIIVIF
jgi:hypothetical protein